MPDFWNRDADGQWVIATKPCVKKLYTHSALQAHIILRYNNLTMANTLTLTQTHTHTHTLYSVRTLSSHCHCRLKGLQIPRARLLTKDLPLLASALCSPRRNTKQHITAHLLRSTEAHSHAAAAE